MEKVLRNIVKIIIVGVLYEANVSCTRLLPPLPYYQNDPYYVPAFIAPYQEYVPVYVHPDVPPPISYQNANSFTRQLPPRNNNYHPPQLFYKNENYHPLPPPGVNYPVTPFASQPHNYKAPYVAQQKANYEISPKPNVHEDKPPQADGQNAQVYTSNIILKDETYPPYYQDDYNKNYNEDDYTDNYADDAPVQKDPCPVNSPYRNFEPGPAPYHPNGGDKYTLCNPYFQPNFGNGVYTVKAPITLLPSRFPPRVEEFVQRIQNYFSTYTEKETDKPQNQTATGAPPMEETSVVGVSSTNETPTAASPTNESSNESETETVNVSKTNITKIQEFQPIQVVNHINETEKVTIELEFVGKKTPTDAEETKTETTQAEAVRNESVQEGAVRSETVPDEILTTEATSTTESADEYKTEVSMDATPANEVLPEMTDTNG